MAATIAACVARPPRRQLMTAKAGFGSDRASSSSAPKGWTRIADISEIPTERRTLPVEVSSVLSVMLYLTPSGRLFCSDANSTAFKFPLTDAVIAEDDGQTTIEVWFRLYCSHLVGGQPFPCLYVCFPYPCRCRSTEPSITWRRAR